MRTPSISLAAAAAMLAAATLAAPAARADSPPPERSCFLSTQWEGWSAPGNSNVLLLRVNISDIYRVELAPGTRVYKGADRFLVNQVRGSSWICSPLDLDLTLSDTLGFHQPLFPVSMRKLSKAEVAALPREDRP